MTEARRYDLARQATTDSKPNFLENPKEPSPSPVRRSRGNSGMKLATGWKGSWGPPTDPRSRMGRLITRIIKEELEPLSGRPEGQALASLMRETATWKAIARSTLAQLGQSREMTTRRAASASRMGAAKEAELARVAGFHRPWQPTSAAELVAFREAEEAKEAKKKTTPPRRTR
jgi:hypothetical protein